MRKTLETQDVNRREFLAAVLREGALFAGIGLMAAGQATAKSPEERMVRTEVKIEKGDVMAITSSASSSSVMTDTAVGDVIVRNPKTSATQRIALKKGDRIQTADSEPHTLEDDAQVHLKSGDMAELSGDPRRIRVPAGYVLITDEPGVRVLSSYDPTKVSARKVAAKPKLSGKSRADKAEDERKRAAEEEKRKTAIDAKLKRLKPGIEEVERKYGRFGIKLSANQNDGTVVVEGLEKNGIKEPKVRIAPGESLDIEYTLDGRTWRNLPLQKTPERRAIVGMKEEVLYGESILGQARWIAMSVRQEDAPQGPEKFRPRKPPAGSPRSAY